MKPVAISAGDPCGIGAEILVKALAVSAGPVRIFGDVETVRAAWSRWGSGTEPEIVQVGPVLEALDRVPGKPTETALRAGAQYVVAAWRDVLEERSRALVTAPLTKRSFRQAGYDVPGHTELLQQLSAVERVAMMLVGPLPAPSGGREVESSRMLRVVPATTHCALADVSKRLESTDLSGLVRLVCTELRSRFGVARPRVAVTALNPHGGEGGLFGDEETRLIGPAVVRAQVEDAVVDGPLPADTLFLRAVGGAYDAVVAMYHDQALIPLKLLTFGRAVNVTLGLPAVRTSPDHGVAYDIAGTGNANPESMSAAIRVARAASAESSLAR